MPRYAANTTVSAEKSRIEIERTLKRYGATNFASGFRERLAFMMFTVDDRTYRLNMPLPERSGFTLTPTGKPRAADATNRAFEQAERQRWRALALYVKAVLEAVEADITTFEEALMAYLALPDGTTVGAVVQRQIAEAYDRGRPVLLLLGDNDAD